MNDIAKENSKKIYSPIHQRVSTKAGLKSESSTFQGP